MFHGTDDITGRDIGSESLEEALKAGYRIPVHCDNQRCANRIRDGKRVYSESGGDWITCSLGCMQALIESSQRRMYQDYCREMQAESYGWYPPSFEEWAAGGEGW